MPRVVKKGVEKNHLSILNAAEITVEIHIFRNNKNIEINGEIRCLLSEK